MQLSPMNTNSSGQNKKNLSMQARSLNVSSRICVKGLDRIEMEERRDRTLARHAITLTEKKVPKRVIELFLTRLRKRYTDRINSRPF